ncbi:omega-amidase NIT2-like [Dysidea avara]|uniref:omega-amidase NIT2-like n=1 Tax=Dysidea avara TaxID=196820 RepID=UPI003323BE93
MDKVIKLGLIQSVVGADKEENVARTCQLIREAVSSGAKVVVLPECFNCPYSTKLFAQYAEEIPGPTSTALSAVAKECDIYIIGGSIPERDGSKFYNTCPVFGPTGDMLSKYHKMYLANTYVPGQMMIKESEIFSPGDTLTVVNTMWGSVGVGICRDLRYPELALHYGKEGCSLLCYPSAYNVDIGSAHWEVMLRARAVDSQVYVCGVCPSQDNSKDAIFHYYGNSMVVDPWGKVIARCGPYEQVLLADIDLKYLEEVCSQLPINKERRNDF